MDNPSLMRYSRHILLDELDIAGQETLIQSHALIVGMGGLGCPAALYLGASGVGKLTLVDHDTVDLGNLQRQIAHKESSIGQPKPESVRDSLLAINSELQVHTINAALHGEHLAAAVADADIVLDCTDNLASRFALNEACVSKAKPLVSGAAIRWEAQISVFHPSAGGACYQCLYKPDNQTNASCAESGVVAPLVGIVGAMQALEAIKILTNTGQSLRNRLLLLDAKTMRWREMALQSDPLCAVCGNSKVNAAE